MSVRIVLLLGTVLSAAHAQTPCPWLTKGSAAKVLGGDVSVTATVANAKEGTCMFSRQAGTTTKKLGISIGKLDTHPCPPGSTALKAIGNEAVQCRSAVSSGQIAETIAGRIRDIYFIVTLTDSGATKPEKPDGDHPSAIEEIAEQVVGNLY